MNDSYWEMEFKKVVDLWYSNAELTMSKADFISDKIRKYKRLELEEEPLKPTPLIPGDDLRYFNKKKG